MRRRIDAVISRAHIDAVEIERQDFVLAVAAFQPEGDERLLRLAPERAVGIEVKVLGELLGDRRSALDESARAQVRPHRPQDAARVDAVMLVEAPVLRRQKCLHEIGRQFGERH